MKKTAFALGVLLLTLSCINRDGPVEPRNNPYDSGGDDWRINGLPETTGYLDTLWQD